MSESTQNNQELATLITPLAYLAAGPLADQVFEPLMSEGGALAGIGCISKGSNFHLVHPEL